MKIIFCHLSQVCTLSPCHPSGPMAPRNPGKLKAKNLTSGAQPAEDVKPKKERAKPVEWDKHKEWTERAIQHLINNPTFRLKLFSDSTSDAKDQSRRKVQGKDAKSILYGELAREIFTKDLDPQVQAEYKADPAKYGRSTQQQFQR